MLEAFKRLFKGETNEAQQKETTETETERTPIEPSTLEEAVAIEIEKLKRSIENDANQYKSFLSALETEPTERPAPEPKTSEPEAPKTEDLTTRILKKLGSEPTVESFVKTIVEELSTVVNSEAKAIKAVPPIGDAYAELVVNRVLRRYPYLDTVAEDGLRLLRRMPVEQLNEELADWVLHALKGRLAEAEKKEAIANLVSFDYDTVGGSSSPNIQNLPQERELLEFAENMGISPEKLKKRLLETMKNSRGGV